LGRPWLFAELGKVFDGCEPDPPPNMGAIVEIMLDHARRLVDFFGAPTGMRQMRKWTSWYTKGFRGSAALRARLQRVESMAELEGLLGQLDPAEPFPQAALRVGRAKGGRTQKVSLPEGYLDSRDDDTPPRGPHTPAELAAWERALQAG
jgi:hypothetical protein